MGHVSAGAIGVATGVQDITINLSTIGALIGQRVVLFTGVNNTSTWSEQGTSDWTKEETDVGGSAVFWRDMDGTEDATYTFRRSIATVVPAGLVWMVREDDGTLEDITISQGGGTTLTLATAVAAQNDSEIAIMIIRLATGGTGFTPPGDNSGTPGNPHEEVDANASGTTLRYGVYTESDIDAGNTGTRLFASAPAGGTRGVIIVFNPKPVEETGGYDLFYYDGVVEEEFNLFYYDGATEAPYKLTEVST